jgi:hypothetical protein
MRDKPLTSEEALALLARTAPRLATLVNGLTPAQLRSAPLPGEWAANQVLAHLRACADIWGKCILTMLSEDMPTLRAVNPRSWIKRTDYLTIDFQPSLDSLARQRAALLSALEPLPPEGWSRKARVLGAGKELKRSVLDYAERLARHERAHLKQVESIVNTPRG